MQTREPQVRSDLEESDARNIARSICGVRRAARMLSILFVKTTSRACSLLADDDRPAMEDMLLSMEPSVELAACRPVAQLQAGRAEILGKYHSLALACAIDFAQPSR